MTHIFATAAAPALRRAGVTLTRTGTPNPTGAPVLRGSLEEGTFEGRFWRPYQRGETDKLYDQAWGLFGQLQPGWARVQAIVDFIHNHLNFGYHFARSTRTAAR